MSPIESERSPNGRRTSRRTFIKQAAAAGLALPAIGSLVSYPASTAKAQTPGPELSDIVEGAKREGELHWVDALVQPFNDDTFHTAFRTMFGLPDSFTARHTLLGTGDIATRIQQELQTGEVTIDLVSIGDLAFWRDLEQAGALVAYQPSELNALEPTLRRLGFPGQAPTWWTLTAYGFVPAWNTGSYPQRITSWFDLIDPALRDRAIQGDIRTSSAQTDTYIALRDAVGIELFERYAEVVNPELVFRTPDQQAKLASGERVLTDFHLAGRVLQGRRADPSLDIAVAYPTEGVVPLPIPAGILAQAPHPNAARLFAEFLASQAGQQLCLSEEGLWPLRTDVRYAEDVRQFIQPLDELIVIPLDWDGITDEAREAARAEFRRIFQVD